MTTKAQPNQTGDMQPRFSERFMREVAAEGVEPIAVGGLVGGTLTEQSELDGLRNLYRLLRSDFNAVVDELIEKGYIDEFRE